MDEFYASFLKAMANGPLERRTCFKTGEEAIYQNNSLLSGPDIASPDLVENIQMEPHLVLFGCGHVGKALYDLAVLQGMKVTILDCREDLLTKERFPKAERVVGEYEELLSRDYPGFTAPYYCIFTHGHRYDESCLLYALRHPHAYIGMIGSKAKVAHCMESIKEKGITQDMLTKLHSPVGLAINAVTPEEIAISIMAQIISVFRQDKSAITIDPTLIEKASREEGVMVRIIEKDGSAPRSVGSMLFVTKTELLGTIGGGAIEKHAIDKAREMLEKKERFLVEHHQLTQKEPLEMACGGDTTLMYKLNCHPRT